MRFVNFRAETGSVVLELVGFGVLLQLPLLMIATSIIFAQHDALAAQAIARDSLRSFLLLDRPIEETAAAVASAFKVPQQKVSINLTCSPGDCEVPGNWVSIRVAIGSAIETAVARK